MCMRDFLVYRIVLGKEHLCSKKALALSTISTLKGRRGVFPR